MKPEKPIFDIPDQSLVKSEPAENSAAWMKRVAKEHGDTSPQKLELRRAKLSHLAQLMESSIKNHQMQKKLFITRNQKAQDAALKKLATLQEGTADHTNVSEYVAGLQLERLSQEQSFGLMIQQSITNSAMVEGLCLVVDSLTLRETVRSKKGKIGTLRFSSTLYAYDAADYAVKTYRRLRKFYDLLAASQPLVAGALDKDDDDEEEENENGYDDEDVVDESDRKKIKEDLGEEL